MAPDMKSSSASRQAFTLVELLCVIAIIGVILALTAFNAPSLFGSYAVRSGADSLYGGLTLARQVALSHNRPSALVIRTTGEKAWQRLAVFTIDPETSAWTQISSWDTLSRGVIIDKDYPIPVAWTGTVGLPVLLEEGARMAAPVPAISDGPTPLAHGTDYVAIGFLPDGSLMLDANVALRIILEQRGSRTEWPVLLAEHAAGRVKTLYR